MRFNLSLAVAIAAAIGWALFVFSVYFLLIFIPLLPFTDWSGSDQAQLFQGMVGIAGFGGGIVALLFAGQQLAHAFGKPFVVVNVTRWLPHATPVEQQAASRNFLEEQVSIDEDQIQLDVALGNMGDAICSVWLIEMKVPEDAAVTTMRTEWRQVSPERVTRQAGEGDALYPGSLLPIGQVAVTVSKERTPGWVPTQSGGGSYTIPLWIRIVTELGQREQTLWIAFEPK
ncbi:MAG: hypothetical protein WD939_10115 [Dehalococcoidia bacterium]